VRAFNVVIERDPETGLFVGYVPGWPGAHSQGASNEELLCNLREVIEMLLEDGEPRLESEFVDVRTIQVASIWRAFRSSNPDKSSPFWRHTGSLRSDNVAHTNSFATPTAGALRKIAADAGLTIDEFLRRDDA